MKNAKSFTELTLTWCFMLKNVCAHLCCLVLVVDRVALIEFTTREFGENITPSPSSIKHSACKPWLNDLLRRSDGHANKNHCASHSLSHEISQKSNYFKGIWTFKFPRNSWSDVAKWWKLCTAHITRNEWVISIPAVLLTVLQLVYEK